MSGDNNIDMDVRMREFRRLVEQQTALPQMRERIRSWD